MILDTLRNKEQYYVLCPRFQKAFEWIESQDLATLPTGRHTVDGDDIFVNVSELELRPREKAALEVHNEYIDIQVVIKGAEEFGWTPRSEVKNQREAFDATKDIGFYTETPKMFYTVHEGEFCILMPEDAHAPMLGSGPVKKLIVKVRK